MDNLYSVIELGKLGLDIEKLKVKVSAENIANVSNGAYIRQKVDFGKIVAAFDDAIAGDSLDNEAINQLKTVELDRANNTVNLDQEVLEMSNAEMRYKVIAQLMQKKFGLLELAMNGGKK